MSSGGKSIREANRTAHSSRASALQLGPQVLVMPGPLPYSSLEGQAGLLQAVGGLLDHNSKSSVVQASPMG